MGLVLSRHRDESIIISLGATRVAVTVVDIRRDKCRLDITAPNDVTVHREEIQRAVDAEAARRANGADDTRGEG